MTVLQQLSNGFLGLTNSKKGMMCLILFFCSIMPMTYLCLLGKLDSTAYATCMSAITVAVTAIFCHTQGKIDQMINTPMGGEIPLGPTISSVVSSVETAIGSGPPSNLPGSPL